MVIPAAVLNHKTVFKPMDWPKALYMERLLWNQKPHAYGAYSWEFCGTMWFLRLLLWTGSGMRNRIFALVHLHHEDWKEEVSIYKRGIRDGKKFFKRETEVKKYA